MSKERQGDAWTVAEDKNKRVMTVKSDMFVTKNKYC